MVAGHLWNHFLREPLSIMGTFYIVATPIGNLEDITLRALRILKEVDFIVCEDTRVTKILLEQYGIKTPLISFHQHTRLQKLDFIAGLLKQGKNLALVSDAGTPGISDPGNELINRLTQQDPHIPIVPIPGPSALTAAASISGFPTEKFLFLGYPPSRKKRKQFFEEVVRSKYPVIFYESPHRIVRTLQELDIHYTKYRMEDVPIVVSRELTKKFETIYRGTIKKVLKEIQASPLRGEFTVVMGNPHD